MLPTVGDWETSCFDRKWPSQVNYDYERPVCFHVWLVCVDGLSAGGVLILNHDNTASSSRQDGTSIDKP